MVAIQPTHMEIKTSKELSLGGTKKSHQTSTDSCLCSKAPCWFHSFLISPVGLALCMPLCVCVSPTVARLYLSQQADREAIKSILPHLTIWQFQYGDLIQKCSDAIQSRCSFQSEARAVIIRDLLPTPLFAAVPKPQVRWRFPWRGEDGATGL